MSTSICPICNQSFPASAIERHASSCGLVAPTVASSATSASASIRQKGQQTISFAAARKRIDDDEDAALLAALDAVENEGKAGSSVAAAAGGKCDNRQVGKAKPAPTAVPPTPQREPVTGLSLSSPLIQRQEIGTVKHTPHAAVSFCVCLNWFDLGHSLSLSLSLSLLPACAVLQRSGWWWYRCRGLPNVRFFCHRLDFGIFSLNYASQKFSLYNLSLLQKANGFFQLWMKNVCTNLVLLSNAC